MESFAVIYKLFILIFLRGEPEPYAVLRLHETYLNRAVCQAKATEAVRSIHLPHIQTLMAFCRGVPYV